MMSFTTVYSADQATLTLTIYQAEEKEKEKEPEPEADDMWSSFTTTKKSKKGKGKNVVEEPVRVSVHLFLDSTRASNFRLRVICLPCYI